MSLLRKTFVLGLGLGAARLLGAAILVVLARVLGVERYGIFGSAMSVGLLLGVAIDMGQALHIGRLVSRDPESGSPRLGQVLANEAVVTFVIALGTWVALNAAGVAREEALTVCFMVVWGGFLTMLDSERAVARALGMVGSDAIVNSSESVGRLLAVVSAAALGLGLVGVGAAFALECGVAMTVFYLVLGRRARVVPERVSIGAARRFLAESVPLGLAGLATVGFYQLDQIFVRALAGPGANGLYAAAVRVVFAVNAFSGLVAVAAYPDLARHHLDPAGFRKHFAHMLGLCMAVAVTVTVVSFAFADPIVRLLYGEAYAGAVPLLRILAPLVIMNALVICGVHAANALGRERRILAVVVAMLVLNSAANALLVPRFGATASAWISTVGEALFGIGALAACWDRILPGRAKEPEPAEEAAC